MIGLLRCGSCTRSSIALRTRSLPHLHHVRSVPIACKSFDGYVWFHPRRDLSTTRLVKGTSDRPLTAPHQQQLQHFGASATDAIRSSSGNANSRRKYFWSLNHLVEKTDNLIAYCTAEQQQYRSTAASFQIGSYQSRRRRRRPLATEFFQVLEAWMEQCLCEDGGIAAADQAQALLQAMLPPRNRTGSTLRQDPTQYRLASSATAWMANVLTSGHYDVVFQAYAVSGGGAKAAEQAEALLLRILEHCREYQEYATASRVLHASLPRSNRPKTTAPPPEPSIKSFNIILNCWAKSEATDAADRASHLLQVMEEWTDECRLQRSNTYQGCRPNERSLVSLIEAWTCSKPNEAPDLALALLQEVMFAVDKTDLFESNHKYRDVKLDVVVFNSVIYAWVCSNRGRKAALQAEQILQILIQWSQLAQQRGTGDARTTLVASAAAAVAAEAATAPNTRTYSMVIMAWAECESREQSGNAARRAEMILEKMLQLYRQGGQHDIKPNAFLVTTCIAAWSRAAPTCAHAPERAEQWWTMIQDLYNETGRTDSDLEPTAEMGNAVISAWARCTSRQDSVPRALAALERLKATSMADLISYNTILDAMSKRGMGKEAQELLHEMEHSTQTLGSVIPWPDRVSYNSVLAALSRANVDRDAAAEEAERLLKRMDTLEVAQASCDDQLADLSPDRLSYTAVINAWSRSDSSIKAQRALSLVDDMIRRYKVGSTSLQPDVVVYTILIKACAHTHGTSSDKQLALAIATEAMQTLEHSEYGPPNDVAYATFLNAIVRLFESAPERESLLEETFRRCAARGLVSRNVLKEMDRGGSRRLFRRLTNNTNKLPAEWSVNVATKDKPLV